MYFSQLLEKNMSEPGQEALSRIGAYRTIMVSDLRQKYKTPLGIYILYTQETVRFRPLIKVKNMSVVRDQYIDHAHLFIYCVIHVKTKLNIMSHRHPTPDESGLS